MKKVIVIISFVIAGLIIHSCKKDKSSEIDWKAIKECNNAMHLDTTAVASNLVGKWQLKAWYCGFCTEPGTHNPDKTVIISFTSARLFTVTENSTIVTQGNWYIGKVDTNNWGLQTSSPSRYLFGYILFCDNQVMFSDSYIDGADNLFDKVN